MNDNKVCLFIRNDGTMKLIAVLCVNGYYPTEFFPKEFEGDFKLGEQITINISLLYGTSGGSYNQVIQVYRERLSHG